MSLNELQGDHRLERLFSPQDRDCALQLWILRIRRGEEVENRILYGRLLPYNHSDSTWYATDDEKFEPVGEHKAELIRVNLYFKSSKTADLLRILASGKDIAQLTAELALKLKPALAKRVATAALHPHIVFRPVAYLLNRDSRIKGTLSPHGSAGALSASLVQTDKVRLLSDSPDTNEALAKLAIGHLNADTGLRFDLDDAGRLGDVELLVFPTLDDGEQELLNVDWQQDGIALHVRLRTIQLPAYRKFRVRLGIYNNLQLVYSSITTVDIVTPDVLDCQFTLPERLRPIADEAEVEIYGVPEDNGTDDLCCRWRIGYIRQINLNVQMMGRSGHSFRFDWLEKVIKNPDLLPRVRAASAVDQTHAGNLSHVGGRLADSWVDANWAAESFLRRVHPQASDGRFFAKLSDSNGVSRLELVEWFKALLKNHPNHQVVVFDPWFEDAGIAMMLPNTTRDGDYIVFTSLPKPERKAERGWYTFFSSLKSWWQRLRSEDAVPKSRINTLLAACERMISLRKNVRLRIFALKFGLLHDRYILVIGNDAIPSAGFHLSNSLQKSNENHPLLITPIPADVLLRVHDYTKQLLKEAKQPRSNQGPSDPNITLLYDSTQQQAKVVKRIEPLYFLDLPRAGNVLAGWTGDDLLRGLAGTALKKVMAEKGFLDDQSLSLPELPGFSGCLNQADGNFSDFRDDWLILGELFANTTDGLQVIDEFPYRAQFLAFLSDYIRLAFSRKHSQEVDNPLSHVAVSYFQTPLLQLFHSANRPESFVHFVKYAALSWAEWYAVRLLWRHSPEALVSLATAQVTLLPLGVNEDYAVQLSLLSQIASEVAIAGETESEESQRTSLINSSNGFLQWMGWNLVDEELKKPSGFQTLDAALSGANLEKKVSVLGWLIQNHSHDQNATLFLTLVQTLNQTLTSILSADQTKALVDSLRGPVRKLSWSEPWLYRDIIEPLEAEGRLAADDLCQIWVEELCSHFVDETEGRGHLFRREAEGNVIEIAAQLYARSSSLQKQKSLKALRGVLLAAKREIQKPLASTSNWNKWNSALVVAMWIYSFTAWAKSKSSGSGADQPLIQLSGEARLLALTRPPDEWRSYLGSGSGELASFIEEVESL
jgi:hypothetical protein